MNENTEATRKLEESLSAIIEDYRLEVYDLIVEKMWQALSRVGRSILESDSMHLLSRRVINGISTNTLIHACRIMQTGGNFESIDEQHKRVYMLEFIKARSLSFEATRLKYPNYLKPWMQTDDEELERLWCEGLSVKELARLFGRNPGAINARIDKLELLSKYGERKSRKAI